MLSEFERLIAWRYLRSRRKERFVSIISAFSMIGVMLGVATLILVTSLMNGIKEEMTSRFIGLGGHITINASGRPIAGYDELTRQLETLPEITSAIPKIEGQVMATNRGRALGAQVTAFPQKDFKKRSLLPDAVDANTLERFNNGEGVILGERLMRNLGLQMGQQITLISPQGQATFAGVVPRMKAYPIIGSFKLGMHLYDSSLIWMNFDEAQLYFKHRQGESASVPMIELMVNKASEAEVIATELQSKLGEAFQVYDWQRSNASLFNALAVQERVMVIILALIILVAAFNIISSLIMLVKDKSSDIAILRTMGASRSSITRIFCMVGTFIGVIGALAGLLLGLLLAAYLEPIKQFIEGLVGQEILVEDIYFLSTLPTQTNPADVAIIMLMALILSFIATLYPARRAASLDPVEALRYE